MNVVERTWLFACAALACGEGLASLAPGGADAWPFPLIAAVPVVLLGYGFSLRGWRYAVVFLVGVAAFWFASVEIERDFRLSPWLRGARRAEYARRVETPAARGLSRRMGLGLGHDPFAASLNRAMLLGERRAMPRAAKRAFVDSGTIHVFAVSGLHVMVVAKVLMVFAALLFVPYRLQGAAAMPAVWWYVAATGAPPSAVRAALMATFYVAAPLFWRKANGLMAWSLAFMSVHLANPRQISDVGSRLSFAVMLVLVLAGRATRGMRSGWLKAICLTAAAWAAGVPIAAMAFGRVSPGGLLANIVLVAAAGHSVAAGAAGVVASFVSETLAAHLNNLSAIVTRAMAGMASVVAEIPFSSVDTGRWGFSVCAAWYVAIALALFVAARARRRRDLV